MSFAVNTEQNTRLASLLFCWLFTAKLNLFLVTTSTTIALPYSSHAFQCTTCHCCSDVPHVYGYTYRQTKLWVAGSGLVCLASTWANARGCVHTFGDQTDLDPRDAGRLIS